MAYLQPQVLLVKSTKQSGMVWVAPLKRGMEVPHLTFHLAHIPLIQVLPTYVRSWIDAVEAGKH